MKETENCNRKQQQKQQQETENSNRKQQQKQQQETATATETVKGKQIESLNCRIDILKIKRKNEDFL